MLQLALLCAAFWTAVYLYDRGSVAGEPRQPVRFVLGLALGAVLAHLGWALLHLRAVAERPEAVWDPAAGFCVLFVPLGPLLLTPTARAFATLPLAFAVARAGCLAAGCCHGPGGEPTPLWEIAALVALHASVRRLPARWTLPAVLGGFGLVRLALEPWRAAPPLGEPLLAPAWIASVWVALAVLWHAWAQSRSLPREAPAIEPQASEA